MEDEAEVIQRVASSTCLELAIAGVAHLSWADEVAASGDGGEGSVGTMTLVVDTTGKPGPCWSSTPSSATRCCPLVIGASSMPT